MREIVFYLFAQDFSLWTPCLLQRAQKLTSIPITPLVTEQIRGHWYLYQNPASNSILRSPPWRRLMMLPEQAQHQGLAKCHTWSITVLLYWLWRIIKLVWWRGKVAQQRWFAESPLKEENFEQFNWILLLSVEGKVFFNIVAWFLTKFLLRNLYINTSMQKVS